MLDLTNHESAAKIDAHAKKCELHTEAESAHAETVAQRTSFAEMRRISLHNGWCNTELRANTQTRKEKTATVEKFHDTVDELDASMENLTMEVAKLFAQVSHQVEVHEGKKIWSMRWTRGYAYSSLNQHDFGIECSNDPLVKVKKLIQDLIWKLQLKFLRKVGRQLNKLSRDKSTTGNIQCEFHPQ